MSVDRTIAPEVHPFGKMVLPDETVSSLPNGIKLHTFSGGDQPVCHLSVVFTGGVAEIGSECVTNLLMSQMIEGTRHHTAQDIARSLDFNGVRVGFRSSHHHCLIDFSMLSHRAHEVMPLIVEIISEPLYPEAELKTAKTRVSSALLASREEVATLAGEEFNELICGSGNPLGQRLSQSEIDSITPELLRNWHKKILSPSSVSIFLSGLLNEDIIAEVSAVFGELKGYGPKIEYHPCPFHSAYPGIHFIDKNDAFQSAVVCGLPTISRDNPDYIPLRLTIIALGGYFGSRLMSNIREDKGLTYGIGASLAGSTDGAYMNIVAQCDCSKTSEVIEEIKREIYCLHTDPPAGDELRRLKLFAMTSLAETLDTPRSILGYYSTKLLVGTPPDYFSAQQKAIESLDSSTIAEMAKKYIDPEKLIFVIAGDNRTMQSNN